MNFKTHVDSIRSENLPTQMLRHVLCPDSKNVEDITTLKLREYVWKEMTSAVMP